MPLPAGTVCAEESHTYSRLFLTFDTNRCRCVAVRQVDGGAILCIPKDGIPMSIFEEAEAAEYPGILGPFMESQVYAGNRGNVSKRLLDVVIFDVNVQELTDLFLTCPPGIEESSFKHFGKNRGNLEWPASSSVLEVTDLFLQTGGDRLQHYVSAAEEFEEAPAGVGRPGIASNTQELLNQLLSQAEVTQRMVTGMKDQFQSLGQRVSQLEQIPPEGDPLHPGGAPTPQLFSANPSALDEERQHKLRQLVSRGPGKLGDLGGGARALGATTGPLGGITEAVAEVDNLDGEPLDEEEALELGKPTLARLLASQTAILAKLAASKAQQQDPLSLLSSTSTETDDIPRSSGVRGIAARQVLIETFRKHPSRVYQVFRERLTQARRKSSVTELEPRDLRYHFQDSVPLGNHRTLTHLSFISASMFEAIERNEMERVKMLVGLQAVFLEQAAMDGGALRLAHLLTCLEEPPFAITELHKAVRAEYAHGQLADPRWVATQLAYLKDLEGISDRTSKYVRPGQKGGQDTTATEEEDPKKPKWRPKKSKKPEASAAES